MGDYKNADHNEAIDVENSIGDAMDTLTQLSNRLYARHGGEHPLIPQIQSAIMGIDDIRWDKHYEALEREAGEDAWWEER